MARRVTIKLETLTDTTLLTVRSQSSVTPDPRPLGDVLGVKSVMVQGFLATVTYDFRVGHTGVLLSVEGAARDAEDVAAQARQFAELEQDFSPIG